MSVYTFRDSATDTDSSPSALCADEGFARALARADASLVLSAVPGGVFVVGPPTEQGPLHFDHIPVEAAWGLAASPQRLAVATRREITVFANTPVIAGIHPDRPGYHDAVFSPRLSFYTGACAVHDMAITGTGLLVSNTRFSTVSIVDGRYNFDPVWKPPFITQILPEDRCHLNGIAVEDGQLRYVTTFGPFDAPSGWRNDALDAGLVLDVAAGGQALCEGLCLPHSPRLIEGRLLVAEAGRGRLVDVDRRSGAVREIATLPGFTRGLVSAGGVLFLGLSRIRATERANLLPLNADGRALVTGVAALDTGSGAILGFLRFDGPRREVFDLAMLPGIRRPALASGREDGGCYAVETGGGCYWMRPEPRRREPNVSDQKGEP